MTHDKQLIERLNARVEWRELGSNFLETGRTNNRLVNPDGPEAAQRISTLTAEVEGYRDALSWAENHDPWLVEQIRERATPSSNTQEIEP